MEAVSAPPAPVDSRPRQQHLDSLLAKSLAYYRRAARQRTGVIAKRQALAMLGDLDRLAILNRPARQRLGVQAVEELALILGPPPAPLSDALSEAGWI